LGNLDGKCITILKTLITHGKELRFNELHRRVLKVDSKFSKPTFLEHLNHLMKNKYVVRKRRAKQNVTYRFNYEKFESLDSFVRYQQHIDEWLGEKEGRLSTLMSNLGTVLVIKTLQSLKIKILEALSPKKKTELYLRSLLINDLLFKSVEDWVIQKCLKDTDYCDETLEIIDEGTKDTIEGIFEGYEEIQRDLKSLVF
jgi:DNA-binding HxlR family transcriptional regulator